MNPAELLASLIARGAEAAAFVTLREGVEATAEALVDKPVRDSDIRQAQVVYADSKLFVGPCAAIARSTDRIRSWWAFGQTGKPAIEDGR